MLRAFAFAKANDIANAKSNAQRHLRFANASQNASAFCKCKAKCLEHLQISYHFVGLSTNAFGVVLADTNPLVCADTLILYEIAILSSQPEELNRAFPRTN